MNLSDTNILFLMKTKNQYILTFSENMHISAILCFATCDWFCSIMSQVVYNISKKDKITSPWFNMVHSCSRGGMSGCVMVSVHCFQFLKNSPKYWDKK